MNGSTAVKKSPIFIAAAAVFMLLITAVFSGNVFAAEKKVAERSKGEKAAEYALALKDKPFKMGGTTLEGFDASGFTQYVFAKNQKLALPRTSAEQFKTGTAVKLADLQAGDLVFYKTDAKKDKAITFVGIYTGKKQFIGAAQSGVRVQSMDDNYWKPKYAGAKRVLK